MFCSIMSFPLVAHGRFRRFFDLYVCVDNLRHEEVLTLYPEDFFIHIIYRVPNKYAKLKDSVP